MLLTNTAGLPQPIADAIAADTYSRGDADISVTQLIAPPRQVALLRAHGDELTEDVSDRVFSLLGQAIHTILERASTTGTAEERLYADILGWKVSGQIDRIDGTTIADFKTASVNEITYGVKAEREWQLNCYAHLARMNGYQVDRIEAIFILRDWSKVRAAKDPSYPQKQVVVVELPLWSPIEAQAYMTERVRLHQEAQQAYAAATLLNAFDFGSGGYPANVQRALPECSDYATDGKQNERWQQPDKWAIYKNGNYKRAFKLCDWEPEAQAYVREYAEKNSKDTYEIVYRPGESTRCLYYCAAAAVCETARAMQPEPEALPFEEAE